MKSEEARIAEAIAVLTTRLDTWGVDDAPARAADYVRDMVRNGWRPRALPVAQPDRPTASCTPDAVPAYLAARDAIPRPERDRRPFVPEPAARAAIPRPETDQRPWVPENDPQPTGESA